MTTQPMKFRWNGNTVSFLPGETIAIALEKAGIAQYGAEREGGAGRYFCGIGACQCCVVRVDGRAVEACLTPAGSDMDVRSNAGTDKHEV